MGNRIMGVTIANNSSGFIHPIPGSSSPRLLPARQAQPVRELTLPGSPARPGPELCAKARHQTEPNRLFQVVSFPRTREGPHHQENLPTGGRKVSLARNTASRTAGTPGAQGGGAARREARALAARPGKSKGGGRRRSRRGRPKARAAGQPEHRGRAEEPRASCLGEP